MIKCKNEINGKCRLGKFGSKTPLLCDVCDSLVPERLEIKNRVDVIRNKNDEELIEVLRHYITVTKCEVCAFRGIRNKCNPYIPKVCNDGMKEYLKEEIEIEEMKP